MTFVTENLQNVLKSVESIQVLVIQFNAVHCTAVCKFFDLT